ncbi:NAD(P)/FAD-dependent oxidoreductase [Streptomyces californicus]|uniref:NAD(P)/FAD-dependent oxidoreductase n=1 Tax=Streptomyces californicus TaxID=67351 RepID=UPI0036CA2037
MAFPLRPGVAEGWGHAVLHCPYCHGWEVRDRSIGVLATGPVSVDQAVLWSQWSDRVTLLTHTRQRPEPADEARLRVRGVRIAEGQVTGLVTGQDGLEAVELADGARVALTALVVAPRFVPRLGGLGELPIETAALELFGQDAGRYVVTNGQGATNVPGVYAAGNVSSLTETVIGAAGAGLRVAAAVNLDLINEDIRTAPRG